MSTAKNDKTTKDFIEGDKEVKVVTDDLSSDLGLLYPFHCPPIDIPFGGGIAAGRIYEFYGEFSAGKTTFALEIVKSFAEYWEALKDPMYRILWIESESTLDKVRAAYMGCPVDKFIIFETDILEEGHKKIKQYLKRSAAKGMKLMVVWDTIAAVSTQKEKDSFEQNAKEKKAPKPGEAEEKDDGKSKINPGGLMEKPRLIRNMLKDITLDLGESQSTFVVLNQATTNKGAYITTIDSSGGHGLKHFSSVRGHAVKVEENTYKNAEGQERKYIISQIGFKKNKLTGFTKYNVSVWVDVIDGLNKLETRLQYMKTSQPTKLIPMAAGGWTTMKIPAGYAINNKPNDMVEIKWQSSRQLQDLITDKYPHLLDWFDYLIYMNFCKDSPLVKIKNIDKVWVYEQKFFAAKKTFLTDREKNVAKLLFSELLIQAEKDEAEAEQIKKEQLKQSLTKMKTTPAAVAKPTPAKPAAKEKPKQATA